MKQFLIICMFLFAGCYQEKSCTIKFSNNKLGHIIVPIKINDIEIEAIFDTGAQGSTITENLAEKTNLEYSREEHQLWFPQFDKQFIKSYKASESTISIGNLKTQDAIFFNVMPTCEGLTIVGNDIINQFCWLFDFTTRELTISKDQINVRIDEFIKIPYVDKNKQMLCSLVINNELVDNIVIDTGLMWVLSGSEKYSICLFLPNTLNDSSRVEVKDKAKPLSESIEEYITVDMHYPFINDSMNIGCAPIYRGPVAVKPRKKHQDYLSTNGSLSMCYAQGYSMMYLDTKDQVIYLKK